jgi:PIN domain nuclease of toxin-antitoxin system
LTVHVDTNVIVRLFRRQHGRITRRAQKAIERGFILSPIVRLELEILRDKERLPSASEIVSILGRTLPIDMAETAFAAVIAHAEGLGWTRDPFDRLIVAAAIADGRKLVTSDSHIAEHFSDAIW